MITDLSRRTCWGEMKKKTEKKMKIGLCSKLIEPLMTIKYTTITSIFQYLSEVSNFCATRDLNAFLNE